MSEYSILNVAGFVLRAGGSYERNKEEKKLKSAESVRAIVHGIFVANLVLKERA